MKQHNVPAVGTGNFGSHQLFPLLSTYEDADGATWIYVKVSTSVSQYAAVSVTEAGVAAALTKALADAGQRIGYMQEAADGSSSAQYGWVQVTGAPTVLTANGAAGAAVPLYTTATAGVLGTTATSQTQVYGVRVQASVAGSTIGRACYAPVAAHV